MRKNKYTVYELQDEIKKNMERRTGKGFENK